MNRTKLKNYAPKARQEFIQAMTDRSAFYGLTATKTEPILEKGDVAVIGGREHPRSVAQKRRALEKRVQDHGFGPTMEALAYTWFNRFVAIRFMELHGYLDHGYRVLSHPEGKSTPEILEHAEHVDLPGLNKKRVIELKIDGTKEAQLYRLLLIAQCNALHAAMPFLFEQIDDETELLLPDNLLHSNSLVRNLVNEIDEEDWQEVEIIGWLYESYISERYEAVIGKVVASEDIPAATQRFTPNWIVRYLVQNTLGRLWLATYPQSALRQQMKYYIEPAEQTPEVQEQLKKITPTSLNPEEITFLDPACGSAHILVEAYDLFKAIYQERGYRAKDIPALILGKNLFGLEIDDRAAQLAAFALLMKARADDRRFFQAEDKVQPHVLALQETKGLGAGEITKLLNEPVLTQPLPSSGRLFEDENELFSKARMSVAGELDQTVVTSLLELFLEAKTFGSLIQVPAELANNLPNIEERVRLVAKSGEGFARLHAGNFLPLIEQAKLLARRFDCVVTNPPYMGNGYFVPVLRAHVNSTYLAGKEDLCACFILQNCRLATQFGYVGMITIPNWMFLSSYESLRDMLLRNQLFVATAQNGRGVWGSDFGSCSFVLRNCAIPAYKGSFRRLFSQKGSIATNEELKARFFTSTTYHVSNQSFLDVPGKPIAYWVGEKLLGHFSGDRRIKHFGEARRGLQTGDGPRFIRFWYEVSSDRTMLNEATREESLASTKRWMLFNNGGKFRKWYGNVEHVVNWERNGNEIKQTGRAIIPNEHHYFKESISWSRVSAGKTAFRLVRSGIMPGDSGPCIFTEANKPYLLAYLNSEVARQFLEVLVPTLTFLTGDIENIPAIYVAENATINAISRNANECIVVARNDWDSHEESWGFQTSPMIASGCTCHFLEESMCSQHSKQAISISSLLKIEEDNNKLFRRLFGLDDLIDSELPEGDIALHPPDREDDTKRLLSYAMGCMMGRYSLDEPGLVYADAGNAGFDLDKYVTFPADSDGILPLTETDWGLNDDTAKRIEEFVAVTWPKEGLEDNLKFIAEALGPSRDEQPRETIRRYLATGFYKDHLRWYKRRPIYWLFSSGKQRAFQCLVYLHRYHEGTLARMRTEYVIPMQSRIASRIDQLEGDKAKATSTSHRKKLQKEQDDLKKQRAELLVFDEKLKHYADMRISLDLDDGVKVNYGKFGDLLAEVKAVTGGSDE